MSIRDSLKRYYRKLVPANARRAISRRLHREVPIAKFRLKGADAIRDDFEGRMQYTGPLLSSYLNVEQDMVMKWHHYLPVYEKILLPFRGKKISLLELGVAGGGSLQMWRKFLGNEAEIYGIDINPSCQNRARDYANVRIGSQADAEFLATVTSQMSSLNIVIDDGSHNMEHIKSSFEILFPQLSDGGIYIIEDLHAAYWKSCGGGYNSKENFFSYVRDLTDDMHSHYHDRAEKKPGLGKFVHSITVYDSMCIITKGSPQTPVWSAVPSS